MKRRSFLASMIAAAAAPAFVRRSSLDGLWVPRWAAGPTDQAGHMLDALAPVVTFYDVIGREIGRVPVVDGGVSVVASESFVFGRAELTHAVLGTSPIDIRTGPTRSLLAGDTLYITDLKISSGT